MGQLLGVGREWVSKLEKSKEKPSEMIRGRLKVLAAEVGLHFYESTATDETPPVKPTLASVASGEPSKKSDCEFYFKALLESAAASGNPNAFPVIHDRLQKLFPLSEWTGGAAPPGSIVITPDDIAKMKSVVATEHARALKQTIATAESRTSK